jgi:hypothetical protein
LRQEIPAAVFVPFVRAARPTPDGGDFQKNKKALIGQVSSGDE